MTCGRTAASIVEGSGLPSAGSSPPSRASFGVPVSARSFRDLRSLLSSPGAAAGPLPWVAPMSITSRSAIEPARIASRHATAARMVSGLSRRPSSMVCRPASIRLASATSPSRVRSAVPPISRRYSRTGSSVRPRSSSPILGAAVAGFSTGCLSPASSPGSSPSMMVMPISDRIAVVSSIRSELASPGGKALFSSSWVT